MKIYRVVDELNKGLYTNLSYKVQTHTNEFLSIHDKHPAPDNDIPEFRRKYLAFCRNIRNKEKFQVLFGFAHREQLKLWLSDNQIEAIYYFNGKILEIEIDDKFVVIGERQCIFNEEKISLVRKTDMKEWI